MIKNYSLLLKSIFFIFLSFFIYKALYPHFFRNVKNSNAVFFISAKDLVKQFNNNEQKSNLKYNNKIITIYGTVEKVSFLNNRKTIILTGNSKTSIICDLDDNELIQLNTLKKNQQLYIKGICKGYLKDVILLNSFIDTKDNYE